MDLVVYPLLSTRSKRAIIRLKKGYGSGWGQLVEYRPKINLVNRLSKQLGMSNSAIYTQIAKERDYLLKSMYGKNIKHK